MVSGPTAPAITYPAAITTHASHRAAAERFLAYLRGADALAVFTRYKFMAPHAASRARSPE